MTCANKHYARCTTIARETSEKFILSEADAN